MVFGLRVMPQLEHLISIKPHAVNLSERLPNNGPLTDI